MFHRLDLHLHSWFSSDAVDPPERLIEAAKAVGLSGIAITDHDSCEVHETLLDKGLANPEGLPVDDFLVIPAVEVSIDHGHLLCYGVKLPYLKGAPVAEVFEEVTRLGGVAVPAHPYDRWRAGIRESVMDTLPLTTIETFNAAVTSRSYNVKAEKYAESRGLVGMAGSDAHHASAIGTAVTAVETDDLSVASVLQALQTEVVCECRYLGRTEGVKKHFANWFRFTKRKRPPKKKKH